MPGYTGGARWSKILTGHRPGRAGHDRGPVPGGFFADRAPYPGRATRPGYGLEPIPGRVPAGDRAPVGDFRCPGKCPAGDPRCPAGGPGARPGRGERSGARAPGTRRARPGNQNCLPSYFVGPQKKISVTSTLYPAGYPAGYPARCPTGHPGTRPGAPPNDCTRPGARPATGRVPDRAPRAPRPGARPVPGRAPAAHLAPGTGPAGPGMTGVRCPVGFCGTGHPSHRVPGRAGHPARCPAGTRSDRARLLCHL